MNKESSDAAKKLIEALQDSCSSARIGNFPFRSDNGVPLLQLSLQFTAESILFRLISPLDVEADVDIPDELAKGLITVARAYLTTRKSRNDECPEVFILPSPKPPSFPVPDDLPEHFKNLASKVLNVNYKLTLFAPSPDLFTQDEKIAWISAEIPPHPHGAIQRAYIKIVSNAGEVCSHPVMDIIVRQIAGILETKAKSEGFASNSRLVLNLIPVRKD